MLYLTRVISVSNSGRRSVRPPSLSHSTQAAMDFHNPAVMGIDYLIYVDVAAKATYIRLLFGKRGIFRP